MPKNRKDYEQLVVEDIQVYYRPHYSEWFENGNIKKRKFMMFEYLTFLNN